MKDRREVFFWGFSGSSLIFCMEVRVPACEWRRTGGGLSSELRRVGASKISWSPDLRMKGRLVDSLRALGRGLFTASTSSVTELVAISFCRAIQSKVVKESKHLTLVMITTHISYSFTLYNSNIDEYYSNYMYIYFIFWGCDPTTFGSSKIWVMMFWLFILPKIFYQLHDTNNVDFALFLLFLHVTILFYTNYIFTSLSTSLGGREYYYFICNL